MSWKQICRLALAHASFWLLAQLLLPVGAVASEIWLSGVGPPGFAIRHPGASSDYMQTFEPDAPWHRAASAVKVFKVASSFGEMAPEADLRTAFADLRRRHIALALEAGLLTVGETCGHLEGYGRPLAVARIAERIRRTGGDLQYLAMDEPLWWGHEFAGVKACRRPISEVARDVAANVAAVKRIFPAVQVGDIEPLGIAEPAGWVGEIMQWAQAYQDAAGEPLAFVDVDVQWLGPWRHQLPELAADLRASHMRFGIIYDGDPADQTGIAWTLDAEQRFVAIEAGLGLTPDQAILQTWMLQPDHMLPETQPGTMTSLVDRYIAEPTRLALRRVNARLDGELTDNAGHPLAGMPVNLEAEKLGDWGAPAMHTLSGFVPAKAIAALFALRINAECHCSGPADIGIGPLLYRDDHSGAVVRQAFQAPAGAVATLAHFQAQPGQSIVQNNQRFPVTGDDPFSIQVPMRSDMASADSGYVALIFLDAEGRGLQRIDVQFGAAVTPIGRVTTDATGHFAFLPSAELLRSASGFRAEFAGTSQYRMAEQATEQ